MRNSKYGFTLLELLIAISLILLLSVVIIPEYKTFFSHSQQQAMCDQLLQAISFARNEAIVRNEEIVLCKSADSKICGGEWEDGYIVKTKDQLLFAFQHHRTGVLHWRAFPATQIALEFSSSGMNKAENSTFWYCEKKARAPNWAIVLNKSGRARAIYPNPSNVIIDDKGKPLNCV